MFYVICRKNEVSHIAETRGTQIIECVLNIRPSSKDFKTIYSFKNEFHPQSKLRSTNKIFVFFYFTNI